MLERRQPAFDLKAGAVLVEDFVQEDLTFTCPFCGKTCHTTKAPVYGVIHYMPPCKMFLSLEPDEFLAAVNRNRRRLN